MPYFNVMLSHMGYRAWQIGILSGFRPFVSMVCSVHRLGYDSLVLSTCILTILTYGASVQLS